MPARSRESGRWYAGFLLSAITSAVLRIRIRFAKRRSLSIPLGVQWLVRLLHPKLFPEPLGPRIAAFHRLYYHREPTETQVRALLETAGLSR
jgi:hypothetical protein